MNHASAQADVLLLDHPDASGRHAGSLLCILVRRIIDGLGKALNP